MASISNRTESAQFDGFENIANFHGNNDKSNNDDPIDVFFEENRELIHEYGTPLVKNGIDIMANKLQDLAVQKLNFSKVGSDAFFTGFRHLSKEHSELILDLTIDGTKGSIKCSNQASKKIPSSTINFFTRAWSWSISYISHKIGF